MVLVKSLEFIFGLALEVEVLDRFRMFKVFKVFKVFKMFRMFRMFRMFGVV